MVRSFDTSSQFCLEASSPGFSSEESLDETIAEEISEICEDEPIYQLKKTQKVTR